MARTADTSAQAGAGNPHRLGHHWTRLFRKITIGSSGDGGRWGCTSEVGAGPVAQDDDWHDKFGPVEEPVYETIGARALNEPAADDDVQEPQARG